LDRASGGAFEFCPGTLCILLRIDRELWQELEEWAADDLRSVNAQVEWLLREAARRALRRIAPTNGRAGTSRP